MGSTRSRSRTAGALLPAARIGSRFRRISGTGNSRKRGPLVVNVALELLDGALLVLDDGLYQVADRYHADDAPAFDYGQMTNAFVRHEAHAVLQRKLRGHRMHGRAHD